MRILFKHVERSECFGIFDGGEHFVGAELDDTTGTIVIVEYFGSRRWDWSVRATTTHGTGTADTVSKCVASNTWTTRCGGS